MLDQENVTYRGMWVVKALLACFSWTIDLLPCLLKVQVARCLVAFGCLLLPAAGSKKACLLVIRNRLGGVQNPLLYCLCLRNVFLSRFARKNCVNLVHVNGKVDTRSVSTFRLFPTLSRFENYLGHIYHSLKLKSRRFRSRVAFIVNGDLLQKCERLAS